MVDAKIIQRCEGEINIWKVIFYVSESFLEMDNWRNAAHTFYYLQQRKHQNIRGPNG